MSLRSQSLLVLLLVLPVLLFAQRPKGKLFIIGGGKRPPEMIREMVDLSGLKGEGAYAVILPMASEEPDSSAFYAKLQFEGEGVPAEKLIGQFYQKGQYPASAVDSLQKAALIYITGGDQTCFMEVVKNSPVHEAIRQAYIDGAMIAGTSAGAAVMSQKMLTGNELKHPEYTGDFRTIEAENLEIAEGLGLLPGAIVDQHFVYRMRMNRLITVALEHPRTQCLGIDESTAIVVTGNKARVTGNGQVIDLLYFKKKPRVWNGLLGGKMLLLNVWLPGDEFILK